MGAVFIVLCLYLCVDGVCCVVFDVCDVRCELLVVLPLRCLYDCVLMVCVMWFRCRLLVSSIVCCLGVVVRVVRVRCAALCCCVCWCALLLDVVSHVLRLIVAFVMYMRLRSFVLYLVMRCAFVRVVCALSIALRGAFVCVVRSCALLRFCVVACVMFEMWCVVFVLCFVFVDGLCVWSVCALLVVC